jgi:hypothetical protein
MDLLLADCIEPGSEVGYQLAKIIYTHHTLGARIVETPVRLAQSQPRKITIQDGPEERCRDAFLAEWRKLRADFHIFNTKVTSRVYGIATLALGAEGVDPARPVDPWSLAGANVFFSTFDPLNTSGSLVLNQVPNAPDFQKVTDVSVSGQRWHRSRAVVVMNEAPIYIAYTSSAFGYVGRSAYQRTLFPLKSYVQTQIANDMVSRKVGLLVAKLKPPGSIVDNLMKAFAAVKRVMLKQGVTNQVLSITPEEEIESLNLQNLDAPLKLARQNILEDIASGTPMPVKLVTQESFAEGFGEGAEDAKYIAHYIDGVREDMAPIYAFMDNVVQYRAWNPEFYASVQRDFPDYENVDYQTAFFRWRNSFAAAWPNLLTEPESEAIKVDETRFKAVIELAELFLPVLDPDNQVRLIDFVASQFSEQKRLFTSPLDFDLEGLLDHLREKAEAANAATAGLGAENAQPGDGGAMSLAKPALPKPNLKAAA